MGADHVGERGRRVRAFHVRAQPGQPARIGAAPLGDFGCVLVKCWKFCHAQGQLGFEKIRLERERAGEMGSRFRNPCLAAQRYAAIVMRHEGIRIDPESGLVLRDRIAVPAKVAQNIAQVVARAGTVRTQRDRAFGMSERFRQAIHILKQGGKMDVSIDKIRA